MHLGVVKVGLLRLAKPEVISQHIIFTNKKNSMIDRTLTTPIIKIKNTLVERVSFNTYTSVI